MVAISHQKSFLSTSFVWLDRCVEASTGLGRLTLSNHLHLHRLDWDWQAVRSNWEFGLPSVCAWCLATKRFLSCRAIIGRIAIIVHPWHWNLAFITTYPAGLAVPCSYYVRGPNINLDGSIQEAVEQRNWRAWLFGPDWWQLIYALLALIEADPFIAGPCYSCCFNCL